MLADYKLYWDPKSNLLFFPQCDTTRSDGAKTTGDFNVHEFRPDDACCPRISSCPRFNAVLMFSFGTWGLIQYPEKRILEDLRKAVDECRTGVKTRLSLYKNKSTNVLFRKFVEANPDIADVRFAVDGDCAKRRGWGIPKTAIVRKTRAEKAA